MPDSIVDEIRESLEAYKLPPMIIMDVTNVCNLRCIHCPQPQLQARGDFKPMHMKWDHFRTVIADLVDHDQPCLLRFVGDGEPLLHPRLLEMLTVAKQETSCIVNLTTNGTLLFPDKTERILDADVDLIDVSVDALTKPTYEKVRRGGSYEHLMLNLFHLLDARARKNASTKVMISFIEENENASETEWFRAFWEPLLDYVMIRRLHSSSGRVKQEESRARNQAANQERYPCPHLWKRLTLDWQGRIKFCAHDWESDSTLGNIEQSRLKEIWQGDTLKQLREEQLSGAHSGEWACGNCTDWASSLWDWGYERLIDRVVMGKPTFLPTLPPLQG